MAKNPFLSSFVEGLKSRYPIDGAEMPASEWIQANTRLAGKPFRFKDYEFQKAIVDDYHPDLCVIKPSQVGLALALTTPVPTPTGWTTMGQVKVGDQILGRDGRPCSVTYVSPIYTDHKCYEITFDTGETIVADANHRWFVEAHRAFGPDGLFSGRGRIPSDSGYVMSGVITTEQMAQTFKVGSRNNYAIPNHEGLQLSDAELEVDPYYLGLWLGDGNTCASVLTAHRDDMGEHIKTLADRGIEARFSSQRGDTLQYVFDLPRDRDLCPRGHRKSVEGITPSGTCAKCAKQNHGREDRDPSTPYDTLSRRLTQLGLLGEEKHIPPHYLRASHQQRLDLLAGLMDSDGSITKDGRCSFYNTNPALVTGVVELVHSLGMKTRTRWRLAQKSSNVNSQLSVAEVSFVAYADTPVFKLQRKFARQPSKGRVSETKRRRIVDVSPCETVPVRCIQVDTEDHLFLAGKGMIPTHNTEVQVRKFLAFLARNRGTSGIFTFPNEKMFKSNSKTRIRPVVTQPAFSMSTLDDEKPNRAMNLYEVNGSFAHIFGMTEGEATSTPADILFQDELDLSNQAMVALFQSRLQNSSWKITQKFSTPTFPLFGIDAAYNASDQREYMVKCEACNHWQTPVFNTRFVCLPGYDGDGNLDEITTDLLERIRLDESYVKCENCDRALNLHRPDLREWVAQYPTRDAHGYRVRPFSTWKLTPAYIVRQQQKYRQLDNIKGYFNTVKGETYSDGNSKLEPDVVKAVMRGPGRPEIGRDVPVAIASDMGRICHLVLGVIRGEHAYPVLFEQVPAELIEERILELRAQYNVVCGGVDRHPYTPTAESIRKASQGKILPIEYRGAAHINLVQDEYEALDYVQINRTKAIDDVVRAIQRRAWGMEGYGHLEQVVIQHLCDMVRVEAPEKPATWEKLTGQDHFMHALVLLQQSIKIHQLVQLQNQVQTKKYLGFMGVEEAPARQRQLGDVQRRDLGERLL